MPYVRYRHEGEVGGYFRFCVNNKYILYNIAHTSDVLWNGKV